MIGSPSTPPSSSRRAQKFTGVTRALATELQSLESPASEILRLRVREAIEGSHPSKDESTTDAMAAAAVGVFVDWLKNPSAELGMGVVR